MLRREITTSQAGVRLAYVISTLGEKANHERAYISPSISLFLSGAQPRQPRDRISSRTPFTLRRAGARALFNDARRGPERVNNDSITRDVKSETPTTGVGGD